jgi:hypothetical protein
MTHMNQKDENMMRELVQWFSEDYKRWIEEKRATAEREGKELFFTPPTELDYASKRLGVNPASFSRWKNLLNPINEINVLLIAANTGDTRPLEIFGFKSLDPDLQKVIANWKRRAPDERKAMVRISQFGLEDNPTRLQQT